jgi:hypothetical protein
MKATIFTLILAAALVPEGRAASFVLPESVVRFDVSNGMPVDHVDVSITCRRSATTWEKLNNGLDGHMVCDDLAVYPDEVDRVPLQKLTDGTFLLPETEISYSEKLFHPATLCVRIVPKFRPGNWTEGDLYVDGNDSWAAVSLCTERELPNFFPSSVYFPRIRDFDSAGEVLSRLLPVNLR